MTAGKAKRYGNETVEVCYDEDRRSDNVSEKSQRKSSKMKNFVDKIRSIR